MIGYNIEIFCSPSPEIAKRYGRKIKARGGRLSDCRGYCETQWVTLPLTEEAVIAEVIAKHGKTLHSIGPRKPHYVLIARGQPSLVVHVSPDAKDPLAVFKNALEKHLAEKKPNQPTTLAQP